MANLDQEKLKQIVVATWREGGGDALVKVRTRGLPSTPDYPIGYCTTLKFILGRTPAEMERVVGLRDNSKLLAGADIFLVTPLPTPAQFRLKGYSQTPAGIATDDLSYEAHVDYPPGLGAPQWEVFGCLQTHMKLLASVPFGQPFRL